MHVLDESQMTGRGMLTDVCRSVNNHVHLFDLVSDLVIAGLGNIQNVRTG